MMGASGANSMGAGDDMGLEPGIELETITTDARDINALQDNTALVVTADAIYAGYVTGGLDVVVAKRALSGGPWTISDSIHTGNADDAHNTVSLGVDAAGYVHVAYDMHDAPTLNYSVSTTPGGLIFAPGSIPLPAGWITYLRFYRAGAELYLLLRLGVSADGDLVALRMGTSGWEVIANPLVTGSTLSPTDNPYIGQAWPCANGDLMVAWTTRIDWWNKGVYYARYDRAAGLWRRADGSAYALPITRDTASAVLLPSDPEISDPSNVSISVIADSAGRPHVAFAAHRAGHREIFHSVFDSGAWRTTQVSTIQAEALRSCPGGPTDSVTRPCDMEVQGPSLWRFDGDKLALLYCRSVGPSRGVWARPAALQCTAWSETGGASWSVRTLRQGVASLSGETTRESGGAPYFLFQQTGAPVGPLSLGRLTGSVLAVAEPDARVSGSSFPVLISDAPWQHGQQLTVCAWMRPTATGHEMAIVDKGGVSGNRDLRLMIWATGGPPFGYNATRAQVLLGASGGWGLIWYPAVTVTPGLISHLAITWDGATVRIYCNGVKVAETPYSGIRGSFGTAPLIVGGNLGSTGAVEPARAFSGQLDVSYYARCLSEADVSTIYSRGCSFGR